MRKLQPTSSTLACANGVTLAERWARIGLGVRCAYNPEQPAVIRQYVALGTQLARSRHLSAQLVFQRMYTLLLTAATDPALPWPWRSQCLEHSAWPLARLKTLLAPSDPAAFAESLARWQAAQEALASVVTGPIAAAAGNGAPCGTGAIGAAGAAGGAG